MYYYFCKHCGHTELVGSSAEANQARKDHRNHRIHDMIFRFCALVPTDERHSLYARPALATIIIEERKKKDAAQSLSI